MALRRHEVKTFKGTDCKVIGRKLAGSLAFSFLWMRIVEARFHSLGTDPVDQAVRIISDKQVRRKGHRLKQIIDS